VTVKYYAVDELPPLRSFVGGDGLQHFLDDKTGMLYDQDDTTGLFYVAYGAASPDGTGITTASPNLFLYAALGIAAWLLWKKG
jgi:hypothetical protein